MGLARSFYLLVWVAIIMTQSGCSDKVDRESPIEGDISPTAEPVSDETHLSPFDPVSFKTDSGLEAHWLPFGAKLNSVTLPDGTQIMARLDTPDQHATDPAFVGGIIGRVANRIRSGEFSVDGRFYRVTTQEAGHALHGGPEGFDKLVWDVTREHEELVFRHTSPDGHQGYPGNLDVTIRAKLTDQELTLRLIAFTDAPTPVNLTHHGYWNPAGIFGSSIDSLRLMSQADRYLPSDADNIPTGDILPVDQTNYDFRQMRPIGGTVMDVNLLVPGEGIREMARLTDGVRTLTLLSDYPGFQIFSGETLDGVAGMNARAALALEPQYPPNAVNQPIEGGDTILRPGGVYRHTIIYRFDGPGLPDEADTQP